MSDETEIPQVNLDHYRETTFLIRKAGKYTADEEKQRDLYTCVTH